MNDILNVTNYAIILEKLVDALNFSLFEWNFLNDKLNERRKQIFFPQIHWCLHKICKNTPISFNKIQTSDRDIWTLTEIFLSFSFIFKSFQREFNYFRRTWKFFLTQTWFWTKKLWLHVIYKRPTSDRVKQRLKLKERAFIDRKNNARIQMVCCLTDAVNGLIFSLTV